MRRTIPVLALLLSSAALAHAQVDRATLAGTVHDATGGVLGGASVTVTQTDTNLVHKVQTNSSGAYLVVNLAPGRYLVEAESQGFAKAVQSVILEVAQRARLDLSLGVEGMAESVTVEDARRL